MSILSRDRVTKRGPDNEQRNAPGAWETIVVSGGGDEPQVQGRSKSLLRPEIILGNCSLVKLKFGKSWIRKEVMEHVGLLIIVRCEDDAIYNVFESLKKRVRR